MHRKHTIPAYSSPLQVTTCPTTILSSSTSSQRTISTTTAAATSSSSTHTHTQMCFRRLIIHNTSHYLDRELTVTGLPTDKLLGKCGCWEQHHSSTYSSPPTSTDYKAAHVCSFDRVSE
ncbi:unnamed protein product [Schistosoma margrebowiei]|uniref:Uncharacterized protein n=1 Tax=Schistosoma margrebowiei TaxID=48269 RepID=A0A183N3G4_9TREM|nr:unnamed protein product [Schistosoma margrebowiei]